MSARRPLACVIGDMDMVRPLGLGGIRCAVVSPPLFSSRVSRFTRAVLPWVDPWEQPEQFTRNLIAFGATQPEPPILYYQDDGDLLVVSRQRETLARYFRFVIPEASLVENLANKKRFQLLAKQRGLPVPPAVILDAARCPEWKAPELQYPIIVKPLTRRPERWAQVGRGAKAVAVESEEALRRLWPALVAARLTVLAQEQIPGDEARIESYHVYVDEGGTVAGEFTGRKIRTWPRNMGHSTALEITDAPDVRELGRRLMAQLGLRGVAKCDFKRAADGRLFLLEINPRYTLWHHLGARAGVNLPALVYADLTGAPRPPVRPAQAGTRWGKLWLDVKAARSARIPFPRWLHWAWSVEAKRILSWDDPVPTLALVWRFLRGGRAAPPQVASLTPLASESSP